MNAKLTVALALCLAGSADVQAQERLRIDHEAGREIVNDWTRAFLGHVFDIDHEAGLVYTVDFADPLSVTVFSLIDGTLVGTFGGGEGAGPGEFQTLDALAGADGGVLMADHLRVDRRDRDGILVWSWLPGSEVPDVCAFQEEVAIPTRGGGTVARTTEGGALPLGNPDATRPVSADDYDTAVRLDGEFMSSNIACIGDVAYVQAGNTLSGHTLDGRTFAVPIPGEFQEAARRRREPAPSGDRGYANWYGDLSHDGAGRLVLTMVHWRLGDIEAVGAVIEPRSGCYSLVVEPGGAKMFRQFMGVYRDSAVVYYRGQSVRTMRGREMTVIDPEAFMIALRPLRPAGGTPCEGAGP